MDEASKNHGSMGEIAKTSINSCIFADWGCKIESLMEVSADPFSSLREQWAGEQNEICGDV